VSTNECLHVRDLLAEYAVSGLSPAERETVESHLEWCAGCRKEAGELLAASTGLGRSLDPVDPPKALEDRVARSVHRAARRGGGTREPRRWVYAIASAAAVVIAAMAIAYATVVTGKLQEARTDKLEADKALELEVERSITLAQRLREAIEEIEAVVPSGAEARQIQLAPASAGQQGGGAVVLVDNAAQHYAVVLLGGLPQEAAPYRVTLLSPAGQVVTSTISTLNNGGGAEHLINSADSLAGVRRVVVRDRAGNKVLVGLLPVVEATPIP
jgi:anti-sigma factor RsiW